MQGASGMQNSKVDLVDVGAIRQFLCHEPIIENENPWMEDITTLEKINTEMLGIQKSLHKWPARWRSV